MHVCGSTKFEVSKCFAEQNSQVGLYFEDKSNGKVIECTCRNNDAGIAVDGSSQVDITGSTCNDNKVGIAYDGKSKGLVDGNELYKNGAGILGKSESTPIVKHNKVSHCRGGIAVAEGSNVIVEGNTLFDNEYGIMLTQSGQAEISGNEIFENENGVHLKGQSGANIMKNRIYYQKYYGISFNDSTSGKIEKNQIDYNLKTGIIISDNAHVESLDNLVRSNLQIGIHARGNTSGKVSGNTLKNNGFFNSISEDNSKVKFKHNKDLPGDKVFANAKLSDNTWYVSVPEAGLKVSLEKLLKEATPGQTIHFAQGVYSFDKPVDIYKSINLVADEPGKVWLTGVALDYLVSFRGDGTLQMSGFQFKPANQNPSNLVEIHSGMLEMDHCELVAAQDQEHEKRAKGAGVLLLGKAKAMISDSKFSADFLGISALDHSSVEATANRFESCGYGIILRDSSSGVVSKNQFSEQEGWSVMAYDSSKVTLKSNLAHNNAGGFACMNKAVMIAEKNTAADNENHGFFIDGDTNCTLLNNKSFENKMAGFSFWGNSVSEAIENQAYKNGAGIETAESANVKLIKTILNNNETGAKVTENSIVTLEECEIFGNETDIDLQDQAELELINNAFYSPDDPDDIGSPAICFFQRGIHRRENDDYKGALEDFSKGIQVDPTNARNYFFRAIHYLDLDESDADGKAMHDLNQSILLDSTDSDVFHLRGKLFFIQGKYQEALQDLLESIRLEPDSYEPYLTIADTYVKLGNIKESIPNYKQYIELGGYSEDDYEEVMEKINTLQLQLDPKADPYEFIPPEDNEEEWEDEDDEDEEWDDEDDDEDDDGENDIFLVGNIAGIPLGIKFIDNDNENKSEEKVEESEAEIVTYYRLADPTASITYIRRNEKKDPYMCNLLDENGEYHGHSWNWSIIQHWVENGSVVEVTYEDILEDINKRKNLI